VQRSGSVTVSTAAASNAAVWKLLAPWAAVLCLPALSGTYRLASCGPSLRLKALLRDRLQDSSTGRAAGTHPQCVYSVRPQHLALAAQCEEPCSCCSLCCVGPHISWHRAAHRALWVGLGYGGIGV